MNKTLREEISEEIKSYVYESGGRDEDVEYVTDQLLLLFTQEMEKVISKKEKEVEDGEPLCRLGCCENHPILVRNALRTEQLKKVRGMRE